MEGPTLAERIAQGPMPLDEALAIAKQIAEALEAAHEKRHHPPRSQTARTSKITRDGTVKVLDFGLAKAMTGDGSDADLSQSPTMTQDGTRDGMILGTAAYMSPEQARGKPVDKRTDIWAFGCVLYEMLTGCGPFRGSTISDTIAAILEREPDWRALPAGTAPSIHRLLQRCLEKDSKRRLHDIADGRIELEDSASQAAVAPRPQRRAHAAWLVAVVAVLAAVAASVVALRRVVPNLPVLRFEVSATLTSDLYSFALSPDGRQLLFSADTGSVSRLWLRPLDQTTAEPLEGTEGASYPFWSPDSRAFGFFADGKLKRFDFAGGLPQALADAPSGRGGTWSSDGTILFAPASTGALFRIAASGGEATSITKPDQGQPSHRFPHFLPGGRRFLFFVGAGPSKTEGVYLGSLDGVEAKRLVTAETAAAYAPPGYLLVARQGVLLARQMDLTSGEVGEAIPVAEPIAWDLFGRSGGFSVSTTGVLAHRAPSERRQLVWVDRTGRQLTTLGPPEGGNLLDPALAPDGQQVAVSRTIRGNFDVWIHEMNRPVARRFTIDPAIDAAAVWSPDGSRLAFVSTRNGPLDLYEKPVKSMAGPEVLLLASAHNKISMDWSPDGRFLLYQATDPNTGWDLWALPLTGERKPFPVVQTASTERCGQFSPDGQWVAYDSNETGRFEVSVQSFPRPDEKLQISTGGGVWPRWRRDGRELFYVAPDGTLMAVPMRVSAGRPPLQAGEPVRLFRTSIVGSGAPRDSLKQQYVVAADGQRFLVNIAADEGAVSPITIVQNWMAALKR